VDKALVSVFVLLLIALAITGMMLSWRKRVAADRRFSVLIPGSQVVAHSTQPAEFSGLYVSTTFATDPLQRIALPGLGFRADSHLLVSSDGVTIAPRGEKPTFIPAHQILQIHRTQVTIDKAVEKDGLTAISWSAYDNTSQTEVEFTSFFRFAVPEIRIACEKALTTCLPTATSKEVAS
jgi:hypothetical protein